MQKILQNHLTILKTLSPVCSLWAQHIWTNCIVLYNCKVLNLVVKHSAVLNEE